MEALTAVGIAALTIYDMCKAVDRGMVIGEIKLEKKSGGQSGEFTRRNTPFERLLWQADRLPAPFFDRALYAALYLLPR
jgi:hypothetical protein